MQISNIKHTLERLGINTKSPIIAIANVGTLIRGGDYTPEALLDKIVGIKKEYKNDVVGRISVQAVVEHIVKNQLDQIDSDTIMAVADARTDKVIEDHGQHFHQLEQHTAPKINGGEVVVKEDGSLKKGGKQVIAKRLYKEHFLGKNMTNKEFVELLMKECGLSKAGANTYSYNLRKPVPGWEIE